ncbi:MAG: cytosine permease [Streptosporangiaceae bacterium]
MLQPENDSWAAIVYSSAETDAQRLGTALVIDGFRLLTCLHVASDRGIMGGQVWVAFPKIVGPPQRRRWVASVESVDPELDVALLRLAEVVPPGVTSAPLRCPTPRALVDKRWWAFGFAESQRGNGAYGIVGEGLGDGYVRIDADQSVPYRLKPGFSGGGVWSPDFEAVVGMVVSVDEHGNGEAVTLHQVDLCFPEERLRELASWTVGDAGEAALAAWSLQSDPEGTRHWGPRARGVTIDSERGFRFQGRRVALALIVEWLDRSEPDRRVLVITGSPGAGKSAVLGRIVTTADALARTRLPADDPAVLATKGSVACAVHAKGKTAFDVATEIARAASAELPDRLEDLAPALREAISKSSTRFNVVLDALDEAATPAEARLIINRIVLPLVQTCADAGVQMVVGTRTRDGSEDLLMAFGAAARVVDLDKPEFFDLSDLKAYAVATLQLEGDERPGNPYRSLATAEPVAARIAELADPNFLVAGLVARTHGLYDDVAADPAAIQFDPYVPAALGTYIARIPPTAGISAADLLAALASAKVPGLPIERWATIVQALTGKHVTQRELAEFATSSAANFLVESSGQASSREFRLSHQALNDALRDRGSWWFMAVQRFAQLSTPTQFLVGATLGVGMSFGQALLAVTLGCVILEVVAVLTGVIGMREGLSTTLLARWTGFGSGGSALVGLVVAVTSAGWFGVQDSFLGQSLAATVGGPPLWAWCLAGGALVTVIVLRGLALMSRVAFITVLGFLALIGYTAFRVLRGHPVSQLIASAPHGPPLSLGAGATVVAGGFIVGAILAPDMTRFNRSGKDVVKQTAVGVTIGEYVTCLTGVLLARAAQTSDIISIVVGASGIAGAIIIAAAVVTANSWNLYPASLATVNAVNALLPGGRLSRTAVTIVLGTAGSVLSAVGIIGKFVSFLTVIGVVVPPVAGIMIAEYFAVRTWRGRLDASRHLEELPDQPPRWIPACLFAWGISAAAGYWVHIGIPAMNSVLLAFLLYTAAGKLGLTHGHSQIVGEA